MTIMKKLLTVILAFFTLFSLVGCSGYSAVPSTEEESRTVMTLTINDKQYDVKYELYRAFFLTYKADLEDEDALTSDEADKYISLINERVVDAISEIYSAFYVCDTIGVNLDSRAYKKKINEYIDDSIAAIQLLYTDEDGNAPDDDAAYEIYLDRLKASYLNYSVSVLLYKYELALQAIDDYYFGSVDYTDPGLSGTLGALEYTKDDIREFYNGEDAVKLYVAAISATAANAKNRADALKIKLEAACALGEEAVINTIIASSTIAVASEIEAGEVIGRYSLDKFYYGEYIDAAFTLEQGEISEVIEIVDGKSDGYYILYKAGKSSAHFDEFYADIAYSYVTNEVGRIRFTAKDALASSVTFTDEYNAIIHANISI